MQSSNSLGLTAMMSTAVKDFNDESGKISPPTSSGTGSVNGDGAGGGSTPGNATTSTLVKDLYSPEDESCLSGLVCLLRSQLEVFAATSVDVSERSSKKSKGASAAGHNAPVNSPVPITPGRVGIRCKHCAHLPRNAKAKGAVSYPNSIRIMNQAVRNWQRK